VSAGGTAGRRDVVVVGAGHNGLIAACYLAAAGLDVEVVERDTVIGGAVSTVERFPGYRIDRGSSLHLMIRMTGIPEELRLGEVGLRYLECDPWAFHPVAGAPGGGIVFATDLDATCASIEAVCGAQDAESYRAFVADWGQRNERIFAAFQGPPSPGRLGRALWGVGRGTGRSGLDLARDFLTSGDALLDATFRSEHLKTALSWLGAQSGPPMHEVATADLVGWYALLHRTPPARPVGGSGALTEALSRRLLASGGRVRAGDGATRIEVRDGRACAVHTGSGDRIEAGAVVAACHVLTTFDLLGDAVPAPTADRVRRTVRVGNGIGMVARLATSALPVYPGADARVNAGMVLAVPDRRTLRAAHGDFVAGALPRTPAVLAMAHTALDPSLAPPGRHSVTVWGQWHPYELAGGLSWADVGAREGERLVETLEAYAPGFAASVEQIHVQTPADLERELGLLRGNVMHLEMSLDAMFAWRPLPELSGYRGPLPGVYLCGASTHPGGGVFGASGRSAAQVVLADRGPVRRLIRRVGRRL
jgi:phytoene dehydrogenase-like protein